MTDENEGSFGRTVNDWLSSKTWLEKHIDRIGADSESREKFEEMVYITLPQTKIFMEHVNETANLVFSRDLEDLNASEHKAALEAAIASKPDLIEAAQEEIRNLLESSDSS